jgi:hypothetical protein
MAPHPSPADVRVADPSCTGHGLTFKEIDAQPYRIG